MTSLRDEIEKGKLIREQFRRVAGSFLLTEAGIGRTFALVALSAGEDALKRERNQANARKAYDTLLRMNQKFTVLPSLAKEVEQKISELRDALALLGERNL